MSTLFIERRLQQMKPEGDILKVWVPPHGYIWICSVMFDRRIWTRILFPDESMLHFEGEMVPSEGVRLYKSAIRRGNVES